MKKFIDHIKTTDKERADAYVDSLKKSRIEPNEFNKAKLRAMRTLLTKKRS